MKRYWVYERDASRYELIIRIIYTQFIGVVLGFYIITRQICLPLQWLGILLLGRRSESLTNVLIGSSEYIIQVLPYTFLLTDERPDIMPKELKFFLNNREYLSFEEEASRVELIVRIFYSIPIFIVAFIFLLLSRFVLALQWLCILFTGERSEGLNSFIQSFVEYIIQVISYLSLVTDERPDIFPSSIDAFSEQEFDQVGTPASGDIIRTIPPISRTTRDKHIVIGILLPILFYVLYFAFIFLLLMSIGVHQ